jgi:hypothetical protein
LEAGAGVKPRSPEWGAREQRGLDARPRLQHAFMPSNVGPNSSRPNQKKTLDSDHGIYRDTEREFPNIRNAKRFTRLGNFAVAVGQLVR